MKKEELYKHAQDLGINTEGKDYNQVKKEVTALKKQDEPEEVKEDNNTAIVYRGSHKVRIYDFDTHGEKFADSALEFATKHKYTVKFMNIAKHNIECPNCGKTFAHQI